MPQMSPMNWFMLFMFFNSIFYLSVVELFFLSKSLKNKVNTSRGFLRGINQTI